MNGPALKIFWDSLHPSKIPSYVIPDDWRWPIFSIDSTGEQVVMLPPARRANLQEFEVSGSNRESVIQHILDRAEAMCLAAGFAGAALVAVRTDAKILGDEGWIHFIQAGMMFTADFGWESNSDRDDYPSWIDMGEMTDGLHNSLIVHGIMGS